MHLSTLASHRRLRHSRRTPLVVLALTIPGANPFSDALPPPLRFQERLMQKNETHPNPRSGSVNNPTSPDYYSTIPKSLIYVLTIVKHVPIYVLSVLLVCCLLIFV